MSKKKKNNKKAAKNAIKKNVTKNNNKKIYVAIAAAIVLVVVALAFAFGGEKNDNKLTSTSIASNQAADVNEQKTENSIKEDEQMITDAVKVKVEMENGEDFVMELYPEYAPQTVENFVDLVTEGFYDGVCFHRVVDGFMAQGGDPEGTGMGGSGTQITGEFAANGFTQNTLSHTRGVISMARSMDYDSASSQFFICYDDASFLDGQYAAFGKVIEGMETVDAFLDVERTPNSMGEMATPKTPIVMKRVTIIED